MEKVKLQCKRLDSKGLDIFWKDVQAHMDDGWRYNDLEDRLYGDLPKCLGGLRITLVRGVAEKVEDSVEEPEVLDLQDDRNVVPDLEVQASEDQEVVESEDIEVDLDSLTKKKELLEFAESKGIEIPEDCKQPAKIKKYLKEKLA